MRDLFIQNLGVMYRASKTKTIFIQVTTYDNSFQNRNYIHKNAENIYVSRKSTIHLLILLPLIWTMTELERLQTSLRDIVRIGEAYIVFFLKS